MEASYYIGIDISKGRLDWHLIDARNTELATGQAANTPKGINKMIGQWKRAKTALEELIVCFEHTGPYGLLLATLLEQSGICYVMVSAAQVQLSLGIRRGKSDPIDARRNICGVSKIGWLPVTCPPRRYWSCVVGCCGGKGW